MAVVIRRAKVEDAAAVRSIALCGGIDAWTVDQYRDESDRSDAVFLVAAESSMMKGFIAARIVPSATEGVDCEIYNIAVSADFRGKGIGRRLLSAAIDRFNLKGCRSVWLEVRESNLDAIQFYENNGFTRVTARRRFYSEPVEDAVVMRLTLVE